MNEKLGHTKGAESDSIPRCQFVRVVNADLGHTSVAKQLKFDRIYACRDLRSKLSSNTDRIQKFEIGRFGRFVGRELFHLSIVIRMRNVAIMRRSFQPFEKRFALRLKTSPPWKEPRKIHESFYLRKMPENDRSDWEITR